MRHEFLIQIRNTSIFINLATKPASPNSRIYLPLSIRVQILIWKVFLYRLRFDILFNFSRFRKQYSVVPSVFWSDLCFLSFVMKFMFVIKVPKYLKQSSSSFRIYLLPWRIRWPPLSRSYLFIGLLKSPLPIISL